MVVNIIRGEKKDLKHVLDLVKGLARYEKAEDQVTAQLSIYEECFESGLITVDLAEANGQIVGCTLYYDTFSTWRGKMLYLEDFYVLEEYRKHGIGQLLFKEFIAESKRRKCAMVKWQVLDWNEPALKFYDKMGATIEKGWWNGKIIF
jgi:GNAT superfamily N-acetyltransferase